jgi:putative ABC transport system substrate-binding protein
MRRREFMTGTAATATVGLIRPARAQSRPASPRLVLFSALEPETYMNENSSNRYIRALFAELGRLGHVEGKNLIIERYGKEKSAAAGRQEMAMQIVDGKPDVVFVVADGPLFKQVTGTIPIVSLTTDPIQQKLIESLAHPGGNITGVSMDPGVPIHGKRIALLREMFPPLKKLALLTTRGTLNLRGPEVRAAADAAGVALAGYPVDLPSSEAIYRGAIAKAKREGAGGIMVAEDPDTFVNHVLVANLVGAAELPAIYPFEEFVTAGGLMAYSVDLVELNKRIANDIHAILSGANPGEIPFYQPSKFELSINLKAAKALSLTVPATLLATADEVIE